MVSSIHCSIGACGAQATWQCRSGSFALNYPSRVMLDPVQATPRPPPPPAPPRPPARPPDPPTRPPTNLAVPQRQLQQRAPAHAAPVEAAEDATAELTVLRRQESR
jgi:hypothetical protein